MGYPTYEKIINLQPVRRLISTVRRLINTVRRLISLVITTIIVITMVS